MNQQQADKIILEIVANVSEKLLVAGDIEILIEALHKAYKMGYTNGRADAGRKETKDEQV